MTTLIYTLDDDGQAAGWKDVLDVLAGLGGGNAIYGDGSDGDHVCGDGELLASGMYHDFTIPDGVTVHAPVGTTLAILFCTGTYTINGAIDMTGRDATDQHGEPNGGAPGAPQAGANGGTGNGDDAGYTSSGSGDNGGSGGRGDVGFGGDGTAKAPNYITRNLGHYTAMLYAYPGGGGGGGAGDSTDYGGGGGEGGRSFVVVAKHIVHGPNNQYLCQGGNGADGGWDGLGGGPGLGTCGGGGGGGGGWWLTVSSSLSGSEAVIVGSGGAGGARSGTLGASSAFVGADITLPLTIVADVNDEFFWNGNLLQFRIAPGVYTTTNDLILAILASLLVDDIEGRTFEQVIPMTNGYSTTTWTPLDRGGTGIGFNSPVEPDGGAIYNGTTLNFGTHNALTDLGFTDGQESTGGTNGSSDGLPGDDPFVVHILN